MVLEINLFGPFEARWNGEVLPIRSRRAQALLAMIALAPSTCVARDRLAATLWPDRAEGQAKASLRQELSTLRRALGDAADVLVADSTVVRLDGGSLQKDTTQRGRSEFLEGLDIRSEPFDDWRRGESAHFEKDDGLPSDQGEQAADVREIFDNPAVLLLGFSAATGAEDDVSFATGLVVDLRTSLGQWRWFPVIGPEAVGWSTDRDVDLRNVAEGVGAAYVIGGMVRRAGTVVRVTVGLSEASSGRLVWSDTFDGDMSDVFGMQEAISQGIVARVVPEIARAEGQRVVRKPPENLRAWELVAQTEELERTGGEGYGTLESNLAQVPLLEEAIQIEPGYSRAWSRLGRFYFRSAMQGWSDDLSTAIETALDHCVKGAELDPTEWEGQAYLALTLIFGKHDFGPARFHAMEAVRLNPSATIARHACGCALEWIGEPEQALKHLWTIFDLNPSPPNRAAVLGDITTCELFVGNHEAAEKAAHQIMNIAPDYGRGLQRVVMTLGHTGDLETAGRALTRVEEIMPDFDEAYVRKTYPYARPEHTEILIEGLRLAGWKG